jgi:uncharacterized membrane protein (DUF106 family)
LVENIKYYQIKSSVIVMVIGLPGYQEVLIWSLILSLIMVILQKYLTNQNEIRNLKNDMKRYQDRINKATKSGDRKEANKLTSEMMKLSGKQFHQNMKPMMVSMIIFLGALWMFGGFYGGFTAEVQDSSGVFVPADVQFTVSNPDDGYLLSIDLDVEGTFGEGDRIDYSGSIYEVHFMEGPEGLQSVRFDELMVRLPFGMPFFGTHLTWFWWYFVIVIPTNFGFRKIMDVQ